MRALTNGELLILRTVDELTVKHKVPPSLGEIVRHLKEKPNPVLGTLCALRERGCISMDRKWLRVRRLVVGKPVSKRRLEELKNAKKGS